MLLHHEPTTARRRYGGSFPSRSEVNRASRSSVQPASYGRRARGEAPGIELIDRRSGSPILAI